MTEQHTIGTGQGFPFIVENIPEELRERPQWIVWRYEVRDEKPTKVPYSALSFERASTTDLMTWGSFDDAVAAYRVGGFDGIGFCFCSADPFVGIDFDKCRNPETGEVDQDVLEFVRSFKSRYVEASVSGTGVHVITTGKLSGGKKRGNREVYGQDRFFVMTGEAIDV
jgi:primase-polymerase (primpol)-like protein